MRRVWTLVALILAGTAGCSGVKGKNACATNDDCRAGYACDLSATQICLPPLYGLDDERRRPARGLHGGAVL